MRIFALALLLAQPAFGQFQLFQVDSQGERPISGVYDLGGVYPSEAATARFRLRNTTETQAFLTTLAIRGEGFALSAALPLPLTLSAGQGVDFSVSFQSASVAGYSAFLEADGVSLLVTATVLARLTGGGPVDFGSTAVGTPVTRRVSLSNATQLTLAIPALSVSGTGFSADFAAAGAPLNPGQTVSAELTFSPPSPGAWTGALTIGDRSYPLSGVATAAPPPRPMLSVALAEARSRTDGTVSVALDGSPLSEAAGRLTLSFQPSMSGAADPAIQLGVIGGVLPFTIAPGDTQVHFGDLGQVNFQTGTTAGAITIAAELGGKVDQKIIVIPPAPVVMDSAQGARTANSIELRVTGFDNTRTAGMIVYTFYDASGSAVATLRVDDTTAFQSYYAQSDAGGVFSLRAVFPVSGDPSKIAEFAVQMTNSAGSTTTGRVKF